MAKSFLIDTDVIIEYLRGSHQAVRFLEGLRGSLYVSAITVAELHSGVRGEEEEMALEQFLGAFEVIAIDEELARRGGLCRRKHRNRHGTGLADALVAMSAEAVGAVLVTFNRRHCGMTRQILIPYRRK
jgi:hypothetical protein